MHPEQPDTEDNEEEVEAVPASATKNSHKSAMDNKSTSKDKHANN